MQCNMFNIMTDAAGGEVFDFEGAADGEELVADDNPEGKGEVEPLKFARDPGNPTKKQIEQHRWCHLPYRSWCRWCVLGRGRGLQHRARIGSVVPIVGIDYFFLTSSGVKLKEELGIGDEEIEQGRARGEITKCLMVRCHASKAVFGHVVPCKGLDEDGLVVTMILSDLEWLGHTRIIMKADGEPALQALVRRAIELAKMELKDLDQVCKEDPAAYDSMSNGGTEVGVNLIRGLFRTLKLCLEQRVNKEIPIDHPFIAWIMEHTSLLLNAMVRGEDGLTAWMRVRGRAFGQYVIGIGESVLYRYPTKGPKHHPHGNVGALGAEGIFLGYNRGSNTFIVSDENGDITTARSITRRPECDRWDPEAMARVRAVPHETRARATRERVRFSGEATDVQPTAEAAAPRLAREMRINTSDLEKYGYDADCAQCKHIIQYGRARAGGKHSRECRARLTKAMTETEQGKERIRINAERIDRSIAERIEASEGQRDTLHGGDGSERPPRKFMDRAPREAGGEREAPHDAAQHAAPHPAHPLHPHNHHAETGVIPVDEARTDEASAHEPENGDIGVEEEDHNMEENTGNDAEMDFVGILQADQEIGSLEPSFDDEVSALLLAEMGSSGRHYRRDGRRAMRKIVSEIYSPPRVTKLMRELKSRYLVPGFAFDLTVADEDGTPWDFSDPDKREKARRRLREQKPYVLIGSPMCKEFSTWQRLNEARSKDPEAMQRARIAATVHIDFVASLYEEQIDGGRYFLHEHPQYASSWTVPSIERVKARAGTQRVHGDQCQFGAEIRRGTMKGAPIKKPSGFLTNAPCVAEALDVRCTGQGGACSRPSGGRHQPCSGRHARDAAIYPRELCRAILKGIRNQLRQDGLMKNGCYGVQIQDDEEEIEKNLRGPAQGYSGAYKDDLTNQTLKDELVKAARATELAFFYSKKVWVKIPKNQVRARGGRRPISVRWVDVNKGDDLHPNYRSRLVARQLKATDASGKNYFAPAPPLEALRTVICMAMTKTGTHCPDWNPNSATRTQISLIDVKRAYFNARIDDNEPATFVELPQEDPDSESMCAQLLRHMYGTRGAADGWQEECSTLLVSLGFKQGDASPNVFRHPTRLITTSVHGDDFTSSGPANALDWLEAAVAEHYEITISPRMGPGPQDAKEGRVLNRIIRWLDHSIEYECDPRQIERLVAECGLEGAKAVATPGVKATFQELHEDSAELPGHLTTAFRGAAARGNYLAADRLDVQFACKEVCRWMSRPSLHAWKAMKRLCRYLAGAPRLVYVFEQQTVDAINVYTDTDWAGCPLTRKSTSGGCVMMGKHAVKHWSSTQTSISLSSGEAEFAGVIRGAGQGLGYQALLKDVGVELPLRVWTDSSAALGICSRQGLGKLRHLDTHTLWIQQAVRSKRVDLRKVDGEANPADLLTKHSLSRQRLESLIALYGCRYLDGRAESAPSMRKGASSRVTMAAADQELDEVAEPTLLMPHLARTQEELDQLHPSLTAPDDEPLEDLVTDTEDAVYQKGLELSEEIRRETSQHGRRKNPVVALLRNLKRPPRWGGTLVTKHPSAGGKSRYDQRRTDPRTCSTWIPSTSCTPSRRRSA